MKKNEEQELISIVVPVYNVEKYLKRCIESLINQTYKNLEIILVNDGSTDNGLKICEEYLKIDNRIKLINKENEGLGITRNCGIDNAKGKYIAFLDSDDYIEADFYEKLYMSAIENNSDMVFASFKKVDKNDNIYAIRQSKLNKEVYTKDEIIPNILYNVIGAVDEAKQLPISACVILYNKEIIDKYKIYFLSERKYISEDIIFNLEFILKTATVSIVPNAYYYYCDNQNSLTRTYKKDRFEKIKIMYEYLIEFMKKVNLIEETKKGINHYAISHIRACLKQEKLNSRIEAYKNIKKICKDKIVKEILKEGYVCTKKQKIFDFFIKKEWIKLIYLIIKIKK